MRGVSLRRVFHSSLFTLLTSSRRLFLVQAEEIHQHPPLIQAGLLALGEACLADADFVGTNFLAGSATMGHGGLSNRTTWKSNRTSSDELFIYFG